MRERTGSYWQQEIIASKGDTKRLWPVHGDVSSGDAGELTTFLHDVQYKTTPSLEQWTVLISDIVKKLYVE